MNKIRIVAAYLFCPLSIIYTLVVTIRNKAFDCGVLRSCGHNIPTIGVGNLSAGGTGKTPHVEYLARFLQNENCGRLTLLSRGYRRKTKGFILASPLSKVEEIGDEPYQMYCKLPDVNVAVCEDRNIGVKLIENYCSDTNIILLDDVYQHRYIRPDVMVLLTDYNMPFYRDRVIPFGNLREPRKGYKRADVIVVSKCPANMSELSRNEIVAKIKPLCNQKVYFSYLEYGIPLSFDQKNTINLDAVGDVLVVAGIANPMPLVNKVKETSKVYLCQFADHHHFSKADMELIRKRFLAINSDSKIILTTEKDYVRLKSSPYRDVIVDLPIYYIPIEVKFHQSAYPNFDTQILTLLRRCNK